MSNQIKVGIVVSIAILLLGAIVTWKSAILMRFTGYEMIGSFENIEGLTTGSEIRYRGFKVGKVMRIDPGTEDIRIYCNIDNSIKFPADSTLRVAFDGLVGMKFLEVRPGHSQALYKPSQVLYGQKTSGIVDFVDMGTQNLIETKKILISIANIVERPEIQQSFVNAVFNIEKATEEINRLTKELIVLANSINNIVADKSFQNNVKGIANSTDKTLSSANKFFEGVGNMQIKPSGDLLFGGLSNQIKGNLDFSTGGDTHVLLAMGEGGPTRNLSMLDVQVASTVAKNLGLRIGMINTYLGGGVDMRFNDRFMLSGDIYDFNNPKPNYPKLRLTGEYKFVDYVNLLFQADDFLNGRANANYSLGVRIKSSVD
ncbi:MAG: MlaD family protein [Candidatus Saganbacteria bacterium]|nr:MlaD family protein [Candidatus Saganbacteria bacterium]